MKISDKLLTPEEVAEKFSVTVNTVRDWLRTGELPGIKIGKIWRVRQQELNEFIDSKVRKGE